MHASTPSIQALRITLSTAEHIRSSSRGEVTQPDTLNYLTQQPVLGGLFCERIFGPMKDWHCACGNYRRERTPGFRCERCGVELTRSSVRRERMGHIELVTPVAHTWFARSSPSIIALLLNLSTRVLRQVLEYSAYLVLDIDEERRQQVLSQVASDDASDLAASQALSELAPGDTLAQDTYRLLSLTYPGVFRAETGAEAVRACLASLDLDSLSQTVREQMKTGEQHQKKATKRLEIIEYFRASGTPPTAMILDVLPVLPPDLRPLVPLSKGGYASSDVNALYERVIYRNNRIKQFLAHDAPDIVLNHERRLLQDACDALFDNARRSRPVIGSHKQPLKSLTDTLKGKKGRFRRNLLGKRVDFSGRSVIVGDTSLKLHQCGLPTRICLELFKPSLIRRLVERHFAHDAHVAKRMVERTRGHDPVVWDTLAEVMRGKVVLLNRAPTLHRLSIQAFEVVWMSDSQAIRLHPCVCSSFNADFDGDQMAVHLPLSDAAQREARDLMLSTRNLRSPASGEPTISISQEMVLGLFYLTQQRPSTKRASCVFASENEAMLALDHRLLDVHTPILLRVEDRAVFESPGEQRAVPTNKRLETTAGRVIFNTALPEQLRFKNYEMTKERIKLLIAESLRVVGDERTAELADALKTLGFKYATKSGISFAISDIAIPPEKQAILDAADVQVAEVEEQVQTGIITVEERYQSLIAIWTRATDEISTHLEKMLDPWGSLSTIIKSGATKAKFQQIRQLSGMRGLMANTAGRIIEIPIRTNYKEGMTSRDAFTAGSAARNGFSGRSMSTRITGYLTRKLVETGMEVWVTERDCGTSDSWLITEEESRSLGLPSMHSRLLGRVLAEQTAGLAAGTLLSEEHVAYLLAEGVSGVRVRSVVTCASPYGVCQQCYGTDLASGRLVRLGTNVGIIAGQSIGEPGTQLSMRAFHSGGIANAQGDIRQGLPRVIELFEGRTPERLAPLAPYSGRVAITHSANAGETTVQLLAPSAPREASLWSVMIPHGQKLCVQQGQWVEIGTPLCEGACDPRALLALLGRAAMAHYLLNEVQRVFRGTGVYLSDKHIECIIRQMSRYVQVQEEGDTPLLPGHVYDRFIVLAQNASLLAQGGTPATVQPVLLGLTRTVLQTESWVAAASFQETSRVLMRAALRGQTDPLRGYKERVILGASIPRLDTAADVDDT